MTFALKDVRFTTRRSGDGVIVYPRLIRDRSFLPKIDIAIQYFESMLRRERREFEAEVLVHFFGDHKLARCMVGCLARSYRFRSPRLEEVVTKAALRRLQRAEIDSSRGLRLKLFDHVNDFGHGFLRTSERVETLAGLERELGLRAGELERLLWLDADEHAVLTRVGAEPRPEDVVAHFNLTILLSLLRHAQQVVLNLADGSPDVWTTVRALGLANSVDVQIEPHSGGIRVTLRGRQDALGTWARHGRRVARTVVQVLERVRPAAVGGSAGLALRHREAELRLTDEVLDVLAGAPAASAGCSDAEGWDAATLAAASASMHGPRGWSLRRLPEPQAWFSGVMTPDLLVRGATEAIFVHAVRSPAHGARLAPIARSANTGEPAVFIGPAASLAPLRAVGARTVTSACLDSAALEAASRDLTEATGVQPRSA